MTQEAPQDLPRVLGFWDGTAITIGKMIGSGIFLTAPAVCAAFLSPVPVLFLWAFAGLLTLAGVLVYAEMASAAPVTGGLYVYLERGYGRPVAFVYGWGYLLVRRSSSLAAQGVAFAGLVHGLLNLDFDIRWLAIAAIAFLTLVNIAGTRASSMAMKALTFMKLAALALLFLAALFVGGGDWLRLEWLGISAKDDPPATAALLALFPILWSYSGWQDATFVSGEIKEPERTIPRFLIASIATVTLVYVLANLVYLYALGIEGLSSSKNAAGDSAARMGGPVLAAALTCGVAYSIFGTLNGGLLVGGRLGYAMAREGLMFRALGIAPTSTRTPIVALAALGGVSIGYLFLTGEFLDLVKQAAFVEVLFGALGAGAVFFFRKRGLAGAFRSPWYPWLPALYILVSAAMLTSSILDRWERSLIVLGVLTAAFPVYWLWKWLFPPPSTTA